MGHYFVPGSGTLNFNFDDPSESRSNLFEFPAVTSFRRDDKSEVINGAQKPLSLIRFLIKHFSQPGTFIIDGCSGTGTTLIAAIREGRSSIVIEQDKRQFIYIKKRLSEMTEILELDELEIQKEKEGQKN